MSAPGYAAVAFRVAARALRNAKGLKNNEGALRQQDVFFQGIPFQGKCVYRISPWET